jgi:2-oxoacid:acceptor oxidoreductase gamma subunit (pyruvate/2-ketoisovalerate family)
MQDQTSKAHTSEPLSAGTFPENILLPLEIRVHGRGGQGGVTCAKLIAATYAQLGFNVQTFGDYGAERTGAPIRSFTRVDKTPIKNRNKVYKPDHLLVLDTGLLVPTLLDGVAPGASLLINSSEEPEQLRRRYPQFRVAVVDATNIAREHGIGTSAVVIINTTIVGSYAAFMGLPMTAVQQAYHFFGYGEDYEAAVAAGKAVRIFEPLVYTAGGDSDNLAETSGPVLPITEHQQDIPAGLKTGSWASQLPRYQEYAAPCSLACPAGNDVVGFIQTLKEKGVAAAAELLLQTQALPSVCGRVCPAPCMKACNRTYYDGPVNIRSLERWIADHSDARLAPRQDPAPKTFAVVGSGPAGLSAAFHLAMLGQKVTIFEKEHQLGGVLRYGIPTYRLPEEVLDRDIARIMAMGVRAECDSRINKAKLDSLQSEFDAVLVCIGLSAPYAMQAAGEQLKGVFQGLEYLARCKGGRVELSGTVVVVGGGNTAIDCARTALRSGARSVKLVYRRSRADMPAIAEEIEEAVREGVQLLAQRQPVAFIGIDKITGIMLAEVELGDEDESGRRRPLVTNRTIELTCTTVLLALGQQPPMDLLPKGWAIEGNRVIRGKEQLQVWLAGDCLSGDGTVAHAIGNGRRTALDALAACSDEPAPEERKYTSTVAPADIRFSHFPVIPPNEDRHLAGGTIKDNFAEVNVGLPGPGEAERCFSCGRCTNCDSCLVFCPDGIIFRDGSGYRIDQEYCKGCGICVAECPRRAMEMLDK